MTIYVSMIDTYMSGWGEAEGKTSILVMECETMEDALIVRCIADFGRDEMIKAEITEGEPSFCGADDVIMSHHPANAWLHRWHNGDRCGVPAGIDPLADSPRPERKWGVESGKDDMLGVLLDAGVLAMGIEERPTKILDDMKRRRLFDR